MSDLWKVGGQAGVTAYASVSDVGVLTLSDGTTSSSWTPGGALSLVDMTITGNTTIGNASTDTLAITAGVTTSIHWDAGTYTTVFDWSNFTTGQADVLLGLNLASAAQFRTASADYLTFVTTTGALRVQAGQPIQFPAGLSLVLDLASCATGEADIVLGDNLADALTIRESTNAYMTFITTNSGEKIQALKAVEMASTLLVSSNLTCGSNALLGDASDDAHVFKGTTTFDCFPALGAHMTLQAFDSGLTSLDTGDASTVITLSIPAGALVIGAALKVTTEIAGANSTTGTLALTGGSSTTLLTISALAAGTLGKGAVAAPTSAATEASFVLSGGGDDIPTAGAVRVVVYAYVMNNLD